MPAAADRRPLLLLDTSAAVPLVVAGHPDHDAVVAAVAGRRVGLAGHAAFETFSVLTRLPGAARRTPATVALILERSFPHSRFLAADLAASLLADLAARGIAGGAVYDALVAATAVEHACPLGSRDGRAAGTYAALGAQVEAL